MSFKANILANYASQIYVAGIGIAVLPLYVKYMGAEAYGLVGFFTVLQVWFNLLDLGLGPTVARETARFRGGASSPNDYRQFIRILEGVFLFLALFGGAIIFYSSNYIASNWLKPSQIPSIEIRQSLELMALIIATRWISGLYRSLIIGSEKIVWLSTANSAIATLRFIGVLPLIIFYDNSISTFFQFQALVAIIELFLLLTYSYSLLPKIKNKYHASVNKNLFRSKIKLSASIAFAGIIGTSIAQVDKLILSNILPLSDYGLYMLGILLASIVLVIGSQISVPLTPKLAKLHAENNEAELIKLYCEVTQLVVIITGTITVNLAFFSKEILILWTNNTELAISIAPVLTLYAIGNFGFTLAAFPYYLQYAKGNMRLHILSNIFYMIIFLPALFITTTRYGVIGAGVTWVTINIFSLLVITAIVHRKIIPNLHKEWMFRSIIYPAIPIILIPSLFLYFYTWPEGFLLSLASISIIGIATFLTSLLTIKPIRIKLRTYFHKP